MAAVVPADNVHRVGDAMGQGNALRGAVSLLARPRSVAMMIAVVCVESAHLDSLVALMGHNVFKALAIAGQLLHRANVRATTPWR